MHAWEAIAEMIRAEGVEYVFGIGDTDLQLYAEKASGITPINVRYEGSAPFMAMAYSRLSGKPGVCSASCGPGVASMVPGMLEAYYGCSPVVLICPSVSQETEGMGEFQECDQMGMMKPITKWSTRVPSTERIPWFIRRAFSLAVNGQPGPVFLEIPYDVGGAVSQAIAAVDVGRPEYVPMKRIRTAGDPNLIEEAADLLTEAKQIVMVSGNGTMLSAASQEFKEFIELLGIPFMATPGGRGILSEEHPLALGGVGLYRSKVGKTVHSEADLLITIGTRNESFQTHAWKDLPGGAKFIQIDIAPFEIGRNWIPDLAIVGDARIVLRQLIDSIKGKISKSMDFKNMPQVKKIVQAKDDFENEVEVECSSEATPIPAKRIVHEVSRAFGRNTILVSENGSQDCWSYFFPYYKVQDGSECVPVAEQTCMGMGVVGAIAAKITRPEKKVVCVTGDGAFQMYMKELPTAAHYKTGCTWVVLNNRALGWIKHDEMKTAGWDTATFETQPDFARLAQACGCLGRRIEKGSEILPALNAALEANAKGIPAVLDFVTGIEMTHFERAE